MDQLSALVDGDLPPMLELVLANQIYIAKEGLHPGLRNRLLRLAAFQNPEFYKAQAMRLSTYDKPRVVACVEDHPKHIGSPRDASTMFAECSLTWACARRFVMNATRAAPWK